MSANPADEALERLNYFNGQRLAATDFRAEQGYHLGMRRVLNRSLYSPGIVVGLEVEKDPANKHRVIVRHGLAFDHLGREIFVPQDVFVLAMGAPSSTKGVVFGNLLVVSYREARKHPVSDGCVVAAPCAPCSGDLAWGAPTRIAADAVFEFLDSWPADDSGRIVIAQVELSKTCEVVSINPGVRKYAVPVKPQTVVPVSLEGEKDIDPANAKILKFHVMGGVPESATLYLRARKFSTLYYTEMGKHKHIGTVGVDVSQVDLTHSHTIGDATTDPDGHHSHQIMVDAHDNAWTCGVDSEDWDNCAALYDGAKDGPIKAGGDHTHKLHGLVVNSTPLKMKANSVTATTAINNTGVDDVSIRAPVGPATKTFALTYVDDLQVKLNGKDITADIRAQLEAKPGQAGKWAKLGDGTAGHELAKTDGTGEIDLLKLPNADLGPGTYTLEFRVNGPGSGGEIQYNLYVS